MSPFHRTLTDLHAQPETGSVLRRAQGSVMSICVVGLSSTGKEKGHVFVALPAEGRGVPSRNQRGTKNCQKLRDSLESKNSLGRLYFYCSTYDCGFFQLLNFPPLPPLLYLAAPVFLCDLLLMLLRISLPSLTIEGYCVVQTLL